MHVCMYVSIWHQHIVCIYAYVDIRIALLLLVAVVGCIALAVVDYCYSSSVRASKNACMCVSVDTHVNKKSVLYSYTCLYPHVHT